MKLAADPKLWGVANMGEDWIALPDVVVNIVEWSFRNGIKYISMKCQAMCLGTKNKNFAYIVRWVYTDWRQLKKGGTWVH